MFKGFDRGDQYVPIYRLHSFDDAIMESPRVVKATRGHVRELNLKRFDSGSGDFETCSRAVTMLCELWSEARSEWFGRAVIAVSNICATLSPHDGLRAALSRTYDVEYLDGSINGPNLIAWVAVCVVKGGTWFDCCKVFDHYGAKCLIIAVSRNFFRLDITCYNDKQLQDLLLGKGVYVG